MIDYLAQVAVFIAIFATVGSGLNLVSGFGGMFSVAHAVYFSVGAYGYALLVTVAGWPMLLSMLAALAIAAAVGAVVAFPALRLSGDYLIVCSLAIQLVAYGILLNWEGVTAGAQGVYAIPFFPVENLGIPPNFGFALIGAALLAVTTIISRLLVRSPWGRVLVAIREDVTAAVALGKHVTRTKVTAFGISAAMSGAGGVLFAGFVGYIDPESFTLHTSITLLAIVLIGGAGTVVGPIVGAIIITGVPEVLRATDLPANIAAQLELLFNGAVLVAFMMLRPQGIVAPKVGATRPARPAGTEHPPSAEPEPPDPATFPDTPVPETHDRPPDRRSPTLEAEDVRCRLGERAVLDDFSITARPGSVVALIGPNGAGKTTFLDVLTGFLRPGDGTMLMDGRELTGLGPERIARLGMIRVFQDQRVFAGLTVLENVQLGFAAANRERAIAAFDFRRSTMAERRRLERHARELLRMVGLEDKATEPAGLLSGGQQRLVAVLRALCADPAVLLLDEPCAGVAGPLIETLRRVIRERAQVRGCAVLVVEHNTEFVAGVADHVAFLDRGRVLRTGTPAEVFADSELSRIYFGIELGETGVAQLTTGDGGEAGREQQ